GVPDGCDDLSSTGACCLGEGNCEDLSTWGCCELEGGIYAGDGAECWENPCYFGACCFTDGLCDGTHGATWCDDESGTFSGWGSHCDPNCCPDMTLLGGADSCDEADDAGYLIDLNTQTEATVEGDNSVATAPDCPLLSPDPVWWHAFSIDDCAVVTIDFCCTDTVIEPYYSVLFEGCPCGTSVRAETVDTTEVCDNGNVALSWTLPAGTYYYPVYSADDGTLGPYRLRIYTEECTEGACCIGDVCSVTGKLECVAGGGDYLGDLEPTAIADCNFSPCSIGSCCLPDHTCNDNEANTRGDCENSPYFGIYHGGVSCEQVDCSFCQVPDPGQCKTAAGNVFVTSDAGACLRAADDFKPADEGTSSFVDLRWRGLYHDFGKNASSTTHVTYSGSPSALTDCGADYSEDEFTVTVYEAAPGTAIPSSLVLGPELFASVSRIQVDEIDGVPVFEYTGRLTDSLYVEDDECYWLEIQNNRGKNDGCYWLWEASGNAYNLMSGQDGDGIWDGSDFSYTHDLSLSVDISLEPSACGSPSGACCVDGVCDYYLAANCPGRFEAGMLCGYFDPPCGTSACCNCSTGECSYRTQAGCETEGGVFVAESTCDSLICPITPGPEEYAAPWSCVVSGDCTGFWANGVCVGGTCYAPKNRYISLRPDTNEPDPVAIKLRLSSMKRCSEDRGRTCVDNSDCLDPPAGTCTEHEHVGSVAWVGEPRDASCFYADGSPTGSPCTGEYVARLVNTPVYRRWSEEVVHIGDCGIVPVATYEARTTLDGIIFSNPLVIPTIIKPGVWHYGDAVGVGTGDLPPLPGFTPPNQIVNVNDVTAYLLTAQGYGSANAPVTWVDLHGLEYGAAPNFIVNISDLQRILFGNEGKTFTGTPDQKDPCDCSPEGGGFMFETMDAGMPVLFTLVPDVEIIQPLGTVAVDVFIGPAVDVAAYEVVVQVSGGIAGSLTLDGITIDEQRPDYVFASVPGAVSVVDEDGARASASVGSNGVEVLESAYLATFVYTADADASGVFDVTLRGNNASFLNDSFGVLMLSDLGEGTAIGVDVECFEDYHCDDDNDCTTNTCTDNVCSYADVSQGSPCDDGLFCTDTDECDGAGTCVGSGNPCPAFSPKCCEGTDECIKAFLECPW
ncbi:MAG: hypothetical protein JSU63_05475, partial [Phycisphaerales bacterium]